MSLTGIKNHALFLNCNYNEKILHSIPEFYREMLYIWKELRDFHKDNLNTNNILNTFIWYNKDLSVGNNLLYCEKLFKAGLWTIKDLFDESGAVQSFDFWLKCGVTKSDYMLWRGIIHSIPKTWLTSADLKINMISNYYDLNNCIKLCDGKVIPVKSLTQKIINAELVNRIKLHDKAKNYYTNKYNLQECDWPKIYTLPLTVGAENIIKELQYKIIHKYIATEKLLFRMNVCLKNV